MDGDPLQPGTVYIAPGGAHQTIDLLRQHLVELSSFVRALSKAVPAEWDVREEAARDVKLSRLRESLISAAVDSADEEGSSGDLCVF